MGDQLTSEQLVTRKTRTGYQKLEWEQTRERKEALDCRVYARAAARSSRPASRLPPSQPPEGAP
jgi:phage terminase large subunit GpA-like protein